MALDDNNYEEKEYEEIEDTGEGEGYIELYPRWSIWLFCLLFSSLFGGILLIRNLFAAGLRKAGYGLLAFVVVYFFATNAVLIFTNQTSLVLILNVAAAYLYGDYFYKKYFPDNDYYPKSIWRALIIAIAISVLMVALLKVLNPAMFAQLQPH